MATRNERKRLAKAKREMLERAVNEAFALEAERKRLEAEKLDRLAAYPLDSGRTVKQRVSERTGIVQRGKFAAREAKPFEPLKHDGNESGYGQLLKRWI